MLRLLVLVVAVASGVLSLSKEPNVCKTNTKCSAPDGTAVECAGDCGCGDAMADECGRPHPTTAVHVSSITDCMANCQVFALEDRCKFIIFHYDNIDENCIIMNDKFDDYIGHCNVRGQSLWSTKVGEGLDRWKGCAADGSCGNNGFGEGTCTSCVDCSKNPCRGFMLSDCTIYSDGAESSKTQTWDNCEVFGRTTDKGTVATWDKEQENCQLYGGIYDESTDTYNGFDRNCKVAMVELGTDPIACGGAR